MKSSSRMLPVWLPFVLLLASAIYIVLDWTHHPIKADQVILPVIFLAGGTAVCGLLEGITALGRITLEGQRATGLEPEAAEELSRVSHEIVRWVELAIAISFSWGALLGLGQRAGVHWSFPIVLIGTTALSVLIAARRLTQAAAGLKMRGLGKGLEGWNGFIYSNKEDPRHWVPKLGGIGYTLNFAHGGSWLLLALLLLPVAVLVLLGFRLRS
jgi:hypothetical protein